MWSSIGCCLLANCLFSTVNQFNYLSVYFVFFCPMLCQRKKKTQNVQSLVWYSLPCTSLSAKGWRQQHAYRTICFVHLIRRGRLASWSPRAVSGQVWKRSGGGADIHRLHLSQPPLCWLEVKTNAIMPLWCLEWCLNHWGLTTEKLKLSVVMLIMRLLSDCHFGVSRHRLAPKTSGFKIKSLQLSHHHRVLWMTTCRNGRYN